MTTDEKEYWKDVADSGDDARKFKEDEYEEFDEALDLQAERYVEKYFHIRRVLRWTENEDAIMEAGHSIGETFDSVWPALTQIAFFAYRSDVEDWIDRN